MKELSYSKANNGDLRNHVVSQEPSVRKRVDCIWCIEYRRPETWYGYCGLYHPEFPESCNDFKDSRIGAQKPNRT